MAVATVGHLRSWGLTTSVLDSEDPTAWTVSEQAEVIEACHVLLNRLAAVQLEVIAAFDAAGGAQQLGARTTSAWLRTATRLDGPAAGSLVNTARALRDDLTHTATALGEGSISYDHVRVIRIGHRRLGTQFSGFEPMLAQFASQNTVRATRRLVDRIIDQYDPSAADDDAECQREHRKAHLSQTFGGWWVLDGLLDPATGEKLHAALQQYAQRVADDDPRSAEQRRADALGEIADRALALTDRISGAAAVTVTVTPDQLHTGDGVCWPHGLRITRPDLGLHTCAATVSYVIGMPTEQVAWEPLAVGMTQRYATRAQRRALAVRDGGCVHPGCTVRPERCLAHHIVHWRDGGPSDLPNLVLLCDFHHRQVHLGREHVAIQGGRYATIARQHAPP